MVERKSTAFSKKWGGVKLDKSEVTVMEQEVQLWSVNLVGILRHPDLQGGNVLHDIDENGLEKSKIGRENE